MSPADSLSSFFEKIYSTRQDFIRQGWEIQWPKFRRTWTFPSFLERSRESLLALMLAILTPLAALRAGLVGNPWKSFISIVLCTLLGACVMAVVADNALAHWRSCRFGG